MLLMVWLFLRMTEHTEINSGLFIRSKSRVATFNKKSIESKLPEYSLNKRVNQWDKCFESNVIKKNHWDV